MPTRHILRKLPTVTSTKVQEALKRPLSILWNQYSIIWIEIRSREADSRVSALDESTELSNTAQLAIFIRGVHKVFTVTEKLLALQPLKGTTTGEDVFIEVQKSKIRLWEAQMLSVNSYRFTTLSAYENIVYVQYAEEFKLLLQQFSNRSSDFKNMQDCFNLFATPTKSNVQNAPIHLQKELMEIQDNSLLKSKFENVELCDFYKKYLEEDHFPQFRKFVRKLICALGSTYKCE
ncbi:General transcription factor II-I repeat domain-containing protein 2 [Eumeta japonica]|uniref:General transcription factor II-I repeat domain-containing protein 2 n=1 Tax=Eumeta variegata TaxID=151549 RepID=A0A4C1WG10_EUMVA|nr:General transcription factor II-I repeat domain-containing protein 2 [Eumeta japonica]